MEAGWRREKRPRNLYEIHLTGLSEWLDEAVGENIAEGG